MTRISDAAHEAVKMLRGLKTDFEQSQEERETEGRTTLVRNIDDTAEATDAVTVTEQAATTMTWDSADKWGMSHWGPET